MKRRLLIILLSVLTVVSMAFIFSACGLSGSGGTKDGKVDLAGKNVRIEIIGIFNYTGQPIEPDRDNVRIYLNGSDHYINTAQCDLAYENNVNVGFGTIIISANEQSKQVYGSVRVQFEIVPGYEQAHVQTLEEVTAALANDRYAYVYVYSGFEIASGQTLTIPAGKRLTLSGAYSEFVNSGTINVGENAYLNLGNGGRNANAITVVNNGAVTSRGTVQLYNGCTVYNSGNFNLSEPISLGKYENRTGTIYSNNLVSVAEQSALVIRKALNSPSVSVTADITEGKCRYVQNVGGKPAVTVDTTVVTTDYTDYGVVYSGETSLGAASVTITAPYNDKQYYGTVTLNYTVIKGIAEYSTYQGLIDLQNDGYYDEYVDIGNSSITGNFTLNADETIYLHSSSISGTLTNNGTIVVAETSGASMTVTGSFINNGTFSLGTSGSFYVYGTFVNGSDTNSSSSVIVNSLIITGGGLLTNYGLINVRSLTAGNTSTSGAITNYGSVLSQGSSPWLFVYDSIDNYGSISGFGVYLNAGSNFTNRSQASFQTLNSTFNAGSMFTNDNGASVIFGTDRDNYTVIADINIVNNGTIKNNSVMDINDEYTNFVNAGSFDNTVGYVWAFDAISNKNINENITIKKRLNESVIVLEGQTDLSYDYDGYPHIPSYFTVDGNTLTSGTYSVSTEYISGIKTSNGKYDTTFSNYGIIKYTVKMTNSHCEYGGTTEATYRINYGSITTSNVTTAVNNRNWSEIKLAGNVTLTGYQGLTLESHQTLYTNGHILTVNMRNVSFINKGKVVVSSIGTDTILENCGLQVVGYKTGTTQYNSVFQNYGEVLNDGIIYISENCGNFQTKTDSGISGFVSGSGVIYSWGGMDFGENSCTLYNRAFMTADSVELSDYVYDYNGTERIPSVTLYKSEVSIPMAGFTVGYSDNVNAGIASVTVTADMFNRYYVGYYVEEFTINRIVGYINSEKRYTLTSSDFDGVNYYKYVFNADIYLSQNIVIPDNVTLDLGMHRFMVTTYTVTFGSGCKLYVSVSTAADLAEYVYIADKITLLADISEDVSYSVLNTTDKSTLFVGENVHYLEVDLNGYSVEGTFSFFAKTENTKTPQIKLYSGAGRSVVGKVTLASGNVSSDGTVYFTMENIQTEYFSCTGIAPQRINVKNCVFLRAAANETVSLGAQKGYDTVSEFENCSFQGRSGISVYCGTHTFKDCTFYGKGAHNSSLCYGNGINLRPHKAATVSVTLIGGSVSSDRGYGIEADTSESGSGVYLSVSGTTISGSLGQASGVNIS